MTEQTTDEQLEGVSADILWGAEEIRKYLRMRKRQFHHQKKRLPIRTMGRSLFALKGELDEAMATQPLLSGQMDGAEDEEPEAR